MYIEGPIHKYLEDLAARKPAPGGGSAAALQAAMGVALMSMVANYTVGNEKYKDVEKRAADLLVKSDRYRTELGELVDKDVEAYKNLSEGMKKHKKGTQELEDVYKKAIEPPYETCKIASECLKLCGELVEIGNRNLITDTAIAAIMLEGAFFSAKYNVYINLKYMNDMKFIESVHRFLSPLEKEMPRLREEIIEKCEDVIAK